MLRLIALSVPMFVFGQVSGFSPLHPQYEEKYYDINQYIRRFPFNKYTVCEAGGYFYYINNDIVQDRQFDGLKTHIKNGISWEQHLDKILLKHIVRGTTVLDIGAHIGTLTLKMSSFVGPKGQVVSFEPQLELFRELYYNLNANRVHNTKIMRYALGDEHKMVHMNKPVEGNAGGTSVGSGGVAVDMVTLDAFNFSNVSLMKIDVEGFEDLVLMGARDTILRNKPVILIEIMGGNFYETATPEVRARIDATISLLESFGYTVKNIIAHDYIAIP